MLVLHFQGRLGAGADVPFQHGRQKHILFTDQIAERVVALEGHIHPVQQGIVFGQRAGGINAGAVQVVRAELLVKGIIRCCQRLLGDDIDHAARFDPPVQNRRRAFKHLNALHIGKLLAIAE